MKKHINKILLILLVLNAVIIYFIFIRSYNKKQKVELDGNGLVSSVEIEYQIQANPLAKIEVKDLSNLNAPINSCVGSLGQSIDISGNFFNFQMKEAKVKLKYDDEKLNEVSEDEIGILWYDKENEQMVVMDSKVDKENNTISFETNHFSEYIFANITEWKDAWKKRVVTERNDKLIFDIAFVIDDSGSMTGNDKDKKRLTATEEFVKGLKEKDRYCVISFADSAQVKQEPTTDKEKIKEAIEKFSSSGGTNISEGLQKGIEKINNDDNTAKVIVLLTDGEDSELSNKKADIIATALRTDISIFSIYLSDGEANTNNTKDIEEIALQTGGEFYYINSNEVVDIFNAISKKSIGIEDGKDSDRDGIKDEIELGGMRNQYGQIVYTNPYSNDTDGDGISDKEEIGEIAYYSNSRPYYKMKSDPTKQNNIFDDYVKIGPANSYLGTWDSGFKLNKNAFKFCNLGIRYNNGNCTGFAYITERTFNQTEWKNKVDDIVSNGRILKDREELDKMKEFFKNDNMARIIEDENEIKELISQSNMNMSDEEIAKSIIITYTGMQGFNLRDEDCINKGLLYFYNPKSTELKDHLFAGNHETEFPAEVLADGENKNPDAEILKALFYYFAEGNSLADRLEDNYQVDSSHPMTEEGITNLKNTFSQKQIVTVNIKGHAFNAYALEKVSESEYRMFVYENNWPYEAGKNPYIRFVKEKDGDGREYYRVGEDSTYNYEGSRYTNADGTFDILIIKGDEVLNYKKN